MTSFTIACDRDFKDKDTGMRATDFVEIVAWRTTAEFVANNFSKGRMALVSGRLQIRNWTDKEGNARKSTEVLADNVYFGDSKRDDSAAPAGDYATEVMSKYGVTMPQEPYAELAGDDGNLPF